MAMHWIKENIQSFGGNANSITLVGWSAGSASVSYHLYANTSKELFHKAILMSGNMLDPWAFNSAPHECSKFMPFMMHSINKTTQSTLNLKQHLQTLKSSKFFPKFSKQYQVIYFGIPEYCFVPTYDNEFAAQRPSDIIENQRPATIAPILIGSTENEANFLYRYEFEMKNVQFPNENHTIVDRQIRDYMRTILKSTMSPFNNHKKRQEFIQQLQGIADINYGINQFINAYINHTNERIYLYRFSYDGKFGQEYNGKIMATSNTAAGGDGDVDDGGVGAAVHGDELGYLLKDRKMMLMKDKEMETDGNDERSSSVRDMMMTSTFENVEYKDEILTRKRMVKMWTNFMKYG